MKIPYSKRSIWGFLFLISLAIMFLFFGDSSFDIIMGVISLLFSIFLFNHHEGIEISKDLRKRKYHSIFKHTIGKWEFLSPVKYVLILRVKQKDHEMWSKFLHWDQKSPGKAVFQLNLIYQNNRKEKLISTNLSKAENYANELAELLKIEIKKAI